MQKDYLQKVSDQNSDDVDLYTRKFREYAFLKVMFPLIYYWLSVYLDLVRYQKL